MFRQMYSVTQRGNGNLTCSSGTVICLRLEIFSDIHGDWKALERALAVEADCYIGAGDQVSWRRNLDRCGEILRTRAGRVWLLPGNHETVRDIEELCARYGLNSLHGRFFFGGPMARGGARLFEPDAVRYAGRV